MPSINKEKSLKKKLVKSILGSSATSITSDYEDELGSQSLLNNKSSQDVEKARMDRVNRFSGGLKKIIKK